MSFFVTLPSNASMDTYPDNTQSNFAVQLSKTFPQNLQNKYEVGLAEISYTQAVLIDNRTIEMRLSGTRFEKEYSQVYKDKFN